MRSLLLISLLWLGYTLASSYELAAQEAQNAPAAPIALAPAALAPETLAPEAAFVSDFSATSLPAQVSIDLIDLKAPQISLSALWSVLPYVPNHEGRHAVYASTSGPSPTFDLPPGRYLILAEREGRRVRMFLAVTSPERLDLKLLWRP